MTSIGNDCTKRVTVPALEALLEEPIPVLDHGFIRVIDYMGADESIVQAARVSYGKGTKQVSEDKGLINYLMRYHHTTPFEMCEIKFHIKLPLFIARQWIRHRTANVNEYSARYSILDKEFYIPNPEHLAAQSQHNKQGRADTIPEPYATEMINKMRDNTEASYALYEYLLSDNNHHPGLARELARMNIPVNVYTQWYWKIDLHNLLHFLRLRADNHAQYEIRAYAIKMCDIVAQWVPFTYEAFTNYRIGGCALSQKALQVVKRMIKGESVLQEDSGMSKREWGELMEKINDD